MIEKRLEDVAGRVGLDVDGDGYIAPPEGYTLTLAGQDVLRQAERVEAEALGVERSVGGRDVKLEGVVRVTCTETTAARVLAPCFAALQWPTIP